MATLNDWWASLTIAQKERIATKAASKAAPEEPVRRVEYPACSAWWNTLDEEHKQLIHDHCTDKHGYLLQEWTEGHTHSY